MSKIDSSILDEVTNSYFLYREIGRKKPRNMTLKSPISSVEWYFFLHECGEKLTFADLFPNENTKNIMYCIKWTFLTSQKRMFFEN